MTRPTVAVGVALGVPEATDFIIGDAGRGVIGTTSPQYTIASGYTTVTSDAYSVSIRRGRWSRLWDSFDAGSASLNLWNHDRDYDPGYLPSPYNRYIVPGRMARVVANDVEVFVGYVDDWDLEYDVDGQSTATMRATDALGVLGQMEFDAWTSTGTTAGTKLTMACEQNEVDWPAALRDFDAGVEALQSDSVTWGSNVKNYLDLIARSELGYLYASAGGSLTFRDRNVSVGVASSVSFGEGGIPFQGISATLGSELLFARVGVDREGGTNQTATVSDLTTWQQNYGPVRSLSITGLLLDTDAQSLALAEYLLSLYDSPRYRISELVVDLTPLGTSDQTSVLSLDITDVVDVTFTPNNLGDPITQNLVIQGIAHDIGVERHVVTFSLIDAPFPYFRIGDADYGVIGTDIIGF